MSTKTIVSVATTIHVPAPDFKPPLRLDIVEVKPGAPVELNAAEADKLIASGVAEPWPPVVEEPKPYQPSEDDLLRDASHLAYVKAVRALSDDEAVGVTHVAAIRADMKPKPETEAAQ